jgi:hypothetical protein
MKRTIFDISDDLIALDDLLTENDGEITSDAAGEALEAWFDDLGTERDTKIDNYCRLIASIDARAQARAVESARLDDLIEADQKAVTRLKAALKEFMARQGITKLETSLHKLTVANNGGKPPLIIPEEWLDDAVNAPEEYHRVFIRLDTEAIRADLLGGDDVPGCAIGERGTHLRIK